MKYLLISDLHFTANPRDEYRWKLFDYLIEVMPEHGVDYLFILGDLCEAKDYHSARLVNRVVDNALRVYRKTGCKKIYILRGNHDGIDAKCPYFRFLGEYPCIHYVDTPWMEPLPGLGDALFLPHSRQPEEDWQHVDLMGADHIFMHATITGAVSETGVALEGQELGMLRLARRATIYSGDVHVPQIIQGITYIGAPYPIRFGDNFRPRTLLIEGRRKTRDLFPPTIKKGIITILPGSDPFPEFDGYGAGDQVKVRIRLAAQEYADWGKLKAVAMQACKERSIELAGVELEKVQARPRLLTAPKPSKVARDPAQAFEEYCRKNKIHDAVVATGRSLLEGVTNGGAN